MSIINRAQQTYMNQTHISLLCILYLMYVFMYLKNVGTCSKYKLQLRSIQYVVMNIFYLKGYLLF